MEDSLNCWLLLANSLIIWTSCVKAQAFQNKVGVVIFGTCTIAYSSNWLCKNSQPPTSLQGKSLGLACSLPKFLSRSKSCMMLYFSDACSMCRHCVFSLDLLLWMNWFYGGVRPCHSSLTRAFSLAFGFWCEQQVGTSSWQLKWLTAECKLSTVHSQLYFTLLTCIHA